MNQGVRSFIALELNQAIKSELKSAQDELKKINLDVKWVEIDNIHLTLNFLGNLDLENLDKAKTALKNTSSLFKPFEITLSELGVFPKIDFPKVIWVGINQGKNELIKISSLLKEELKKFDFTLEDREFVPHLTLGRVRSPKNKNELKNYLISSRPDFTSKQEIKEVTLFKSELKPRGPVYTVLASFSFFLP